MGTCKNRDWTMQVATTYSGKAVSSIYKESTFANIELTFGTKGWLEMDDLRVLEISERNYRLTKYIGC